MKKELEVKKPTLLTIVGDKYNVEPAKLYSTLKNSILCGKDRPATDEEMMTFLIIAKQYDLNPFTKEIYAFPDKKGGLIAVLSTDGWSKIMTRHPNYQRHYYTQSEEIIELNGAKPCPEWMEIHIVKAEGEVVVREYLDEVYRELSYANPWKTHTKRMLRHKTKIQGAREAFGITGIYDKDEADRIVEAQIVESENDKGSVEMPKSKSETKNAYQELSMKSKYKDMLESFKNVKELVGDVVYYDVLKKHGYSHCNEISKIDTGNEIMAEMSDIANG